MSNENKKQYKYKIGDRIRIKEGKLDDEYYKMKELKGKIATIKDINKEKYADDYIYEIDLDNGIYLWKDDDFEEVTDISDNNFLISTEEAKISTISIEPLKQQIKVKYLDENLTKMEKIDKGDLVDLRASQIFSCKYNQETKQLDKTQVQFPYQYKQGETLFVKLGFAMLLPEGYKANVYPRSSTFKNYGLLLTNSVGQIDHSYSSDNDEWGAMFYATRDGEINYDDRILQFEITPQTMNNIKFDFVETLGDIEERGGFGSTGIK